MPPLAQKLFPFLGWRHLVTRATLVADLLAGLVGALVVLPQAVAYATLAGLPPEYGLYCAMLPVAVAALWGSSRHQVTGPTNTISLAVFAMLAPLAVPGSPAYIKLALTLALLMGVMQLAMGLARMGKLVNFISHTVVVGFTAGAGVLIIGAQLRNFFGLPGTGRSEFFANVTDAVVNAGSANPWITATSVVTVLAAIVARRLLPRFPYMIVAMLAGSAFAFALTLAGIARLPSIGVLPSGVPPLSAPSFDVDDWRRLASSALALTVLALAQAVSVARAVAARSGQRIDGNREFIGQGLSNIVGAFTSAYPSSGSFNRIWVNYDAGAKTPLAAVFSAGFLIVVVLLVAPLSTYLPLAVMAALLFVVAWGLIDVAQMRRIAAMSRGETLVLALTFASTLVLQLDSAIFVGVLASLFVYLNRTTRPALTAVVPDAASAQRRFIPIAELRLPSGDAATALECPQLALLRMDGSLFFGAVEHVRDELDAARRAAPQRRHMLLIGTGVNFVDSAGAALLVDEAKTARDEGATLYLCNLKARVRAAMHRGEYLDRFGVERVFETKQEAIAAIYPRLDVEICRTCRVRLFNECQSALPDGTPRAISAARNP